MYSSSNTLNANAVTPQITRYPQRPQDKYPVSVDKAVCDGLTRLSGPLYLRYSRTWMTSSNSDEREMVMVVGGRWWWWLEGDGGGGGREMVVVVCVCVRGRENHAKSRV